MDGAYRSVTAYRAVLGGRTRIYDTDANNFASHLGFAWSPNQSGATVVRGGYGLYYDTILGAVFLVAVGSESWFDENLPNHAAAARAIDEGNAKKARAAMGRLSDDADMRALGDLLDRVLG